jgi:hypothetical protein
MTPQPLWLVLVLHIAPTIAAVAALIAALRGRREVQAVRLEVNGRVDELIKAAHTEGYLKGLAERGTYGKQKDRPCCACRSGRGVAGILR